MEKLIECAVLPPQNLFCPHSLFNLIIDDSIEVENTTITNDDAILVTYKDLKDIARPPNTVNIVIAAYATSKARLELYLEIP